MKSILDTLREKLGETKVREHEPMSLHTTIRIGGPSEFYVEVDTIDNLVKAVMFARSLDLPVFVFGAGSNCIVSDNGLKGLVIKNNCRKFDVASMRGQVVNQTVTMSDAFVTAESGVITNQLVRYTIDQGLSGIEYALGIPGTIGGAVVMNANYPKKNILFGDAVYRATILTSNNEVKEVEKDYFHFAFNYSSLQRSGDILLKVVFLLKSEDKNVLWHRGTEAVAYRTSTQPKVVRFGSTFRNIAITNTDREFDDPSTALNYYIEKVGLGKRRVGDVAISETNPRYILNMGAASATDVVGLVRLIKQELLEKCGVEFDMPVRIVGE